MPSERVAPLTEKLVETLREEAGLLKDLERHLERQLEALQEGQTEALSQATAEAEETASRLDDIRRKAKRQAGLLGRILETETDDPSLETLLGRLHDGPEGADDARLAEARQVVRKRADAVNQRSETLQFALHYAAQLNHDVLIAMKEATTGADGRTYTSEGEAEASTGEHALVNAVG